MCESMTGLVHPICDDWEQAMKKEREKERKKQRKKQRNKETKKETKKERKKKPHTEAKWYVRICYAERP